MDTPDNITPLNVQQPDEPSPLARISCARCGLTLDFDEANEEEKTKAFTFMQRHDLACPNNPLVALVQALQAFILRNSIVPSMMSVDDLRLFSAIRERNRRNEKPSDLLLLPPGIGN